MNAAGVVDVLTALDAAGVDAWVDGGWGVDALASEQTREHGDLDLAVDRDALERVQRALEALGLSTDTTAEPAMPSLPALTDE